MTGYLTVLAGRTRVALPAVAVERVGELGALHAAPLMHDAVWGVMRHGERLVPLLHLGAVLGLAPRPEAPPDIVVIVRSGGRLMALGVEEADEVVRREPAPLPSGLNLTWAAETVREGDRVIPIVDLENVAERLARVGAG